MATIQSVQEQPAAADAPGEAGGPGAPAASEALAGGRGHGQVGAQPAPADEGRAGGRGQFFGPTAAVTIIAALIASMTLAAVTAFNTLRSDMAMLRDEIASAETGLRTEIGSLRTEMRDEIASAETGLRDEIGSLRDEIGSVRAELHGFRTEVAAVEASLRSELREFRAEFNEVALDHTERLTRLEAAHPHPAAS